MASSGEAMDIDEATNRSSSQLNILPVQSTVPTSIVTVQENTVPSIPISSDIGAKSEQKVQQ